MIEAAHSGLPVNLAQVPAPPGSENEDFEFVDWDGSENGAPPGDRDEMYKKLEQDLISQIRVRLRRWSETDHIKIAQMFPLYWLLIAKLG